jgi:Uncharacterised methyltransferase family (DUF6094)
MSRLHNVANLGYEPTHVRVILGLTRLLELGQGNRLLRAIDLTCGNGIALQVLVGELENIANSKARFETFGIELHEGRAEEAKTRLASILDTDALTARILTAPSIWFS